MDQQVNTKYGRGEIISIDTVTYSIAIYTIHLLTGDIIAIPKSAFTTI